MANDRDDYDSPWKLAIGGYLQDFMAYYFPDAHDRIDWTVPHVFVDHEVQPIIHDAEIGRRLADKVAQVTLLSKERECICIHIEVEGDPRADFPRRVYVCNYRLFDRYESTVASLAVLADESSAWRPNQFESEALGCRLSFRFPVVKLIDYAGREDDMAANPNAFALVTAAYLKARATRRDMAARAEAKWSLIRTLYRRGWDRQKIIDLFVVLDWMMQLPDALETSIRKKVHTLEEEGNMAFITSIERLAKQEGLLEGKRVGKSEGKKEGLKAGEARSLLRLLEHRFGPLEPTDRDKILAADRKTLAVWFDRAIDAPDLGGVFS